MMSLEKGEHINMAETDATNDNRSEVYLDNAATSFPKPDCVINSMIDYMENNGTSSSRGSYKKAIEADKMIYETRKGIGKLFNFHKPSAVIFTANITEALNMAINGILKNGDHVITSNLEHNAVWRCLKTLERDKNITITYINATSEGYMKADDVENRILPETKLIVFNHASNVIGTIQPIREIGSIAKKYNIPFLVDTAQTAGVIPIDIEEDNISLLAFTGHKGLLGPTGTGGLIINWDGEIKPLKAGGTGGDSAYPYQPDYLPNKFEAGTMNVVGIAGLNASTKFLSKTTIQAVYEQEKKVISYALKKLEQINGIQLYGPKKAEQIVGVISFNVDGLNAEEVGYKLDEEYNIMVRAGLHCSPLAHEIIGTKEEGTVRIGIGYYTTVDEIDRLIAALVKITEELKCTSKKSH